MTLLINRYNYTSLSRKNINGSRKYYTPGGEYLPSVTTILGQTADKSHLTEWRKNVGHKRATEITTEAANRGTRLHKYIEMFIESGTWPTPGSNPYAQQAHKMAEEIKTNALINVDEIWGTEVSLYFPHIYAGTTDLVGTYKGNPAICDFKQTNKPKKEEWVEDYYLQLTAYAISHNEIYKTNIQEGHIFMCSKDFKYQQFDLWPSDFSYWENKWWQRCEQYYSSV